MNSQFQFLADAKMMRSIEKLAEHYAIPNAQVIQRAIAMLKIASQLEDSSGDVTFVQDDGRKTKVVRNKENPQ